MKICTSASDSLPAKVFPETCRRTTKTWKGTFFGTFLTPRRLSWLPRTSPTPLKTKSEQQGTGVCSKPKSLAEGKGEVL